MKEFKIIVEKHADGYVAYPLGVTGVVVGEGETFGLGVVEQDSPVLEVFVAEASFPISLPEVQAVA